MSAPVRALANSGESTNFLRVMANVPGILNTYKPLRESILGPGELESRIKVIAYLAASYANESPYEVSKFHILALEHGLSEEDVRAIRMEQDSTFSPSPKEHAALKIARELTRTVTLDDIEGDEVDIFSADQLTELVAVVALANFDNRFSNALEIEHDPTH
jgi:alkylhydroperoxidase family enzyme